MFSKDGEMVTDVLTEGSLVMLYPVPTRFSDMGVMTWLPQPTFHELEVREELELGRFEDEDDG